jgi:hypothetical protein
MSARGTSNSNSRGNTAQRRARRIWLLTTFGDGYTAPCFFCDLELDCFTITADRIVPGILGGTYANHNIRPACLSCNAIEGSRLRDLMGALRRGIEELVLA